MQHDQIEDTSAPTEQQEATTDRRPAVLPLLDSDGWPATDEELLEDGYARHGLRLLDPFAFVIAMRDQQAIGFPYSKPSVAEREVTQMWDAVFMRRAARGELTGTTLDREVLAAREKQEIARIIAESEKVQAQRKRQVRRLVVLWGAAVLGIALAAVVERGL